MFNDDLPKPKTTEFPRNLDKMSVEELKSYIADLQAEIIRAEQDMHKKEASKNAASSFFKL
jgi:uncharacterized small protein (DUF1192 family)